MNDEVTELACPACGRTDVPQCIHCHNRLPHGDFPGTWLPCPCRGVNPLELKERVLANTLIEAGAKRRHVNN